MVEKRVVNAAQATAPGGQRVNYEKVFSYAGTPTVSSSARWYPWANMYITSWLVSLDTIGSTKTVLGLLVNGVRVSALAIDPTVTPNINPAYTLLTPIGLFANMDYVTVSVLTVGSGASNLTVQVRFS